MTELMTREEAVDAIREFIRIADRNTDHCNAAKRALTVLSAPVGEVAHDGCKCASCQSLDREPAELFVQLLSHQHDTEAAESLRTREALITAAADRAGRLALLNEIYQRAHELSFERKDECYPQAPNGLSANDLLAEATRELRSKLTQKETTDG